MNRVCPLAPIRQVMGKSNSLKTVSIITGRQYNKVSIIKVDKLYTGDRKNWALDLELNKQ